MTGASINTLPPAPRRYRPSQHEYFETTAVAQKEDRFRSSELYKIANTLDGDDRVRAKAIDLAKRIDPDRRGGAPPSQPTLASKQSCRTIRDVIGGQLYKFVQHHPHKRFLSGLPSYGDVPERDLCKVDPRLIKGRWRTALMDRGASNASGYLFLVLEGEHQIPSGRYCIHGHGIAEGDMIDVFDALRDHPAFQFTRSVAGKPKPEVCNRVEIKREPLSDLPSPLTYPFKHWTARYTDPQGRRSQRMRIRGTEFARHLLWLDRWKPADLILMMGMRVGRSGFVRTRLHA